MLNLAIKSLCAMKPAFPHARRAILLISVPLSGCLAAGDPFGLNAINDLSGELLGTYAAPTLAASPNPSTCGQRGDARCRQLDELEERLYAYARAELITWVYLVDNFYKERARQFPHSADDLSVRQKYSFQRMLAEQMDNKKITETEWVYLNNQKDAEISATKIQNAANQSIINYQGQINNYKQASPQSLPKNCTTTRSGNSYYTTCN
jgi:hypothetical protein